MYRIGFTESQRRYLSQCETHRMMVPGVQSQSWTKDLCPRVEYNSIVLQTPNAPVLVHTLDTYDRQLQQTTLASSKTNCTSRNHYHNASETPHGHRDTYASLPSHQMTSSSAMVSSLGQAWYNKRNNIADRTRTLGGANCSTFPAQQEAPIILRPVTLS